MLDKLDLSEQSEDYLEAIYDILEQGRDATVSEVAEMLGVKKPTAHNAIKILKEKGYVEQEAYKNIHLTGEGKSIAKAIINRHLQIREFFIEVLDVPYKDADNMACKMEHILNEDSFDKLVKHTEFIKNIRKK